MSDIIDLHDAMRFAGYLAPEVNMKWSQLGTVYTDFMSDLEERVGVGLANDLDDAEGEIEELLTDNMRLRKEVGELRSKLEGGK